jgi:hypothetical protein
MEGAVGWILETGRVGCGLGWGCVWFRSLVSWYLVRDMSMAGGLITVCERQSTAAGTMWSGCCCLYDDHLQNYAEEIPAPASFL